MSVTSNSAAPEKVAKLALDLNQQVPRSPRETLAGYIIAARMLDKCRAVVNGSNGPYHFNCPLDQMFLKFTGIEAEAFKEYVASGATDAEVEAWIEAHAKAQPRIDIIKWNNDMRYKRLSELPDAMQEFMEDYIPEVIPKGRVIHHFFDIYDIEEGRM